MIARMLWKPDIDIEKEMNEFIDAYYGPAASEIREYVNLIHDNNQAGKGVRMLSCSIRRCGTDRFSAVTRKCSTAGRTSRIFMDISGVMC